MSEEGKRNTENEDSIVHVYDNPSFQKEEENEVEFSENVSKKKKKKNKKEELAKSVGIFQLFHYADTLDIILMIIGLVCSAAHGIALPIMIIVFGEMTDSFVSSGIQVNITVNSTLNASSSDCPQVTGVDIQAAMTRYAYYFIAIGFSVLVLATIQIATFLLSSSRQTQRIREKFFYAVLHQHMGWFDTHELGTLNTRLTDDVNKIKEGLGDKICIFLQFFCTFISGIIIGFVYGWKLTLVILSVSPLIGVSAAVWSKVLATLTSKELTSYAKAGAIAEEVLVAIRTVVAFNGQHKASERYEANLVEAKQLGVKKSITTNVSLGLSQFFIFCAYALAFWYGTKLAIEEPENYSIGKVLIVFFSVIIGTFSLGQASPNLESIASARGAAYEVYKTIDEPRPIDSGSKEGHKPDRIKGDIEFKNIRFSYPTRPDVKILQGLNLKVQSGTTIALVGASGCGKSTTIQLLQRFYDPLGGEITLDGQDIRTLNVKWLRENIGIVSQEPVLFATTIAENIRYGREDATDAEIEQAIKEANAYDFISKLPDGLNTMVGERGAQLSGGQKQRIAIARAIVKNPKILLLDEATSALDNQSEYIVQTALDKARAGRTTIVIAHRLSTIRTADIIAGFQNGVVCEQGTHSELMEKKGLYYSLVMQQSMKSKDEDNEYESDEMDETEDELEVLENENAGDSEIKSTRSLSRRSIRRRSTARGSRRSLKKKQKEGEEDENLPEASFLRILSLNKKEWHYLMVGLLASLICGAVYPCFGIIFAKIIGVFAETDPVVKSQKTILFSLLFLLLGAILLVAMSLQGYTFGVSGETLTLKLRSLSFKAILRQEISFFDDHKNSVGVLITRLATDASLVKGAGGSRLGLAIQSICSLLIAVIVAFVFSWQLTLLILACIPFLVGANFIRMKSVAGHASKDQSALEASGKISTETVENIRTVVSLTREEIFFKMYCKSLRGPYRAELYKSPLYGLTYAIGQSINFFVNAAVFRLGSWLIAHCQTQFENMYIVFSVIVFAAMQVGQSSSFAPDLGKAKVSAQRIFALLEKKPKIDIYSTEGRKLDHFDGNIEFQDVHFAYPTRKKVQVLQGLNVKVSKGQTLALVGSSGCGKSTSVQLLERFYDPINGHVLVDGNDITSLNLAWLRSQIGIVSQEPILFDTSIAENIRYGDNSRSVTQEEIEEAAKKANIHSFIEDLPQKYGTKVGDKGAQLSGGQKQRIAIARALLRNPKVLLLDEATSALDTESEKIVQEALDEARQGRTCIIIAHRLSTIQNADIIAVISNGEVVEQGTHSELIAKGGAYYALANAQSGH
ncbi:ATP-dependent translocase ABCB1-like isoform X2 [Polypterus senegalus]|uniref:ATP-dependent translocase ABCB1-like isoform X2 n=1 Tax=Polypterus senegalus TaxID=55291 RepID=UPI001964E9DE|nr:ATP-dependent translocase ABCB1-like isoform X2 [Polypterus senegalus]